MTASSRFTVRALLALAMTFGCASPGAPPALPPVPLFPDLPPPVAQLEEDSAETLHFASSTPYDFDVLLAGNRHARASTGVGTLVLPAEASAEAPVAAMVLLHGSGGIRPGREQDYAELLAANGIAAFVVDYYAPRGIQPDHPYMLKVLSVTEFDAMADAYGALELLSRHPSIDAKRIGLAGFSYGGMAARFAMDERIRRVLAPRHPGFAAFVDVYGPCFQVAGTTQTNGSPLLTLRGTDDASNDLAACTRREQELRDLGVEVEAHVYEGAGHAWETQRPLQLYADAPYVTGCEMVYDNRGRSSVDGRVILDVPVETSRAQRIAMRGRSGDAMLHCVRAGYVMGNDPVTTGKGYEALLDFLDRHL